jgi:hypothetical protein
MPRGAAHFTPAARAAWHAHQAAKTSTAMQRIGVMEYHPEQTHPQGGGAAPALD